MKIQSRSPEPFIYSSANKDVGVLLIHGFTGTTAELRTLGQYLKLGYTVHAPLLRGHGVTPEEMRCTTWVDWYASAKEGYDRLKEEGCQDIIVIGLSMGGLLALKIAQHLPVLGIVTLCAPIKVRNRHMALARYLQYVKHYIKRKGSKAEHIEQELYVYDKTPVSCVASLEKLIKNVDVALPFIEQPILVVQSEKDETVDPCSGQMLYDKIGSSIKELAHFKESSHIITLDKEREHVFKTIHQFIQKLEQSNTSLVAF